MILKNYKNWAVILSRKCLVTGGWLAGRGQAWVNNKFGSMTSRLGFLSLSPLTQLQNFDSIDL